MSAETITGILIVTTAGVAVGTSPWPIKLMHKYRYEHWAFVAMLVGLIIAPWSVTLGFCPNSFEAYQTVDTYVFINSNLFSLCWGIANILYLLCLARIGVSLTNGILTGIGVSIGVIAPMIFKGTGAFDSAPDLFSSSGLIVLIGVLVMLIAVRLVSKAGLARESAIKQDDSQSRNFIIGLFMAVLAGILSAGISFAFVYSQAPIVAAMKAQGAADIPANVAVWAAGLLAGALLNVLYPAYLMTKNRSWCELVINPRDLVLAAVFGLTFFLGVALMGKGMLLLGALGASIGFGIYQSMQMLGGQAVGLLSGEWKNSPAKPRNQMLVAVVMLIAAAIIMSFGNAFS